MTDITSNDDIHISDHDWEVIRASLAFAATSHENTGLLRARAGETLERWDQQRQEPSDEPEGDNGTP